jgi:hypothetical protein
METFAHFEIYDLQGNRAAEGHKVRNFFSSVFFNRIFYILYNSFADIFVTDQLYNYIYFICRKLGKHLFKK